MRGWEEVADYIGKRPRGLTEHMLWVRLREDYRLHLEAIAVGEGHLDAIEDEHYRVVWDGITHA